MLPPAFALAHFALAQGPGGPPIPPGNLPTLRGVPVPRPIGADRYVRDPQALIALGKTLFWDMQAGSDGKTACASCHFHAGADHRNQNQLASPANATVAFAANARLTANDFPFRQQGRQNRFVAGSAGVIHRQFLGFTPNESAEETLESGPTPQFSVNGIKTRQVTSRNSPSVINAVFNVRNFWDGRARETFNGGTGSGASDAGSYALVYRDGRMVRERVQITNASLASQAVGPLTDAKEMSYQGRISTQAGRKLLLLTPLGRQRVAADDSVLGGLANPSGNGLRASYESLIQAAFRPEYWNSPMTFDSEGAVMPNESSAWGNHLFRQMEVNFGLFWGLALQAYQSTLVSDETRYDRFAQGDTTALNAQEQQGLQIFTGNQGRCGVCHAGAEFTRAAYSAVFRPGSNVTNPEDLGFFRIGVTAIGDDPGLNANDSFGVPLIFAARAGAANGTFKVPGLRNVEFTGPYFHDGSRSTLDQVLAFYDGNPDFPQGGNLGPGIGQINLNANARAAVVAFLRALTDDRVRFQRAPFDHPSLCVSNGHTEVAPGSVALDVSDSRNTTSAADRWALVPAVGSGGSPVPLQTFDELLRGIGNDGTRANTMTESCQP
jgi:cytochrome c peroxidase